MARAMRKMQVPAYVPLEDGVQSLEKRGVLWLLTKTIDMDIDEDEESDMWSMPDISLLPISMSIFAVVKQNVNGRKVRTIGSCVCVRKRRGETEKTEIVGMT